MPFDHQALVAFSKSWGLFYLILLAVIVVGYALKPSNRARFTRAKHSILDKEDRPDE